MVSRTVVGAHYGWLDWLAQRITAVIMIAYTLMLLGIVLYRGGMDYGGWRALFAGMLFRVATLLFALSLLWHAWIGARDIWMDYIKPTALRLGLEVLTVLALIAYACWTAAILWGRAG